MEFPPRRMLLAPWLPMGGLAMLFAPRGVGKTHIALEVGYAVATASSFLRWHAPEPHPVLLIDGEMPAGTLQERLSRISARYGVEPPWPESLRIVASDLHSDGLPDLSDFDAQGRYDEVLGDAKLIIVDNISTLCRSGRDNDAESWTPVQEWALARRREGRAVLFVHHAGKGGTQRGTSRKEDVLDTVIALRRPEDYKASEGARFEVHFEKTRGFTGPDAEPFEATLSEAGWDTRAIEDVLDGRVWALHQQGVKQRDIAQEVGKSAPTVNRIIKRLEALA
jgi:putative DNA primase/helicase